MKKINIALLVFTLVCAFFTILGELDKGIIIVLKDSSIILTATLPYIFRKLFKLKISEGTIFVWLVFIFLAHYMGVTAEFYNKWEGFDKVTHTMSGVLTAYVAMMLSKDSNKIWLNILFMLSFSAMCAFLWETFEFVCNLFFGGDAQRVAETGVTDTMMDMIVAFIGASIFSIGYFVKQKIKSK